MTPPSKNPSENPPIVPTETFHYDPDDLALNLTPLYALNWLISGSRPFLALFS